MKIKKNWKKTLFLFTVVSIGIFSVEEYGYKEDIKALEKYNNRLFYNVLDGGNSRPFEEMLEIDHARSFAFFSWFWGDYETLLSPEFVDELKDYSPFSKTIIKNVTRKLNIAYYNSCCRYPIEYTPYRKWFAKGLSFFVLFIAVCMWLFWSRKEINIRVFVLTVFVGTTLIIVAVSIMFKIEYRVYYPLLLINIILVLLKIRATIKSYSVFFILMIIFLPLRYVEYYSTAIHLKEESSEKRLFQKELKEKFSNQTLIFDYFTFTLLNHNKVFLNNDYGNNRLLIYGDYVYNFSNEHMKFVSSICESNSMLSFFECLSRSKENFTFVLTDFRAAMYQDYFEQIYGVKLRLIKLENEENALNTLKYSFVWDERKMDYYRISSFEPIGHLN